MPTYLTPGIYIEEIDSDGLRPAQVWRADCADPPDASAEIILPGTAAFIGITARATDIGTGQSLIGRPTLVKSWGEFVDRFGESTGTGYLPAAVHGFFANGGPACIIISIAEMTPGRASQLPRVDVRDFFRVVQERTGLAAIRPGHEPGILCIPDLMALFQQGQLDLKGVRAVHYMMIDYCELQRNCIAILDTPPGLMPQEVKEWRFEVNYDSSRAALYYPWLIDSGREGWGTRVIPPCGHIAGVIMRTQIEHGVHKTPANEIIFDAEDLDVHVARGEQDLLNPIGVNILQSAPSGEIRIWGARTLTSDAPYRWLKTRRVMMTIERSMERALLWATFETLNRKARERICCDVQHLLRQFWQAGALAGEREEDAFYVTEELDPTSLSLYYVGVGLAVDAPGIFNQLFRLVFFTDDVIPDRAAPKLDRQMSANPEPGYSGALVDDQPPPDIFISYSRSDWGEFVEPLIAHLRAQGLSVWVDQHLLQGGQDWMDEINHALKLCRLMILCVSPEALDSRYVKMEYRYFFNANKPILPIICREAALPAELSGIQFLAYDDQPAIAARTRGLLTPTSPSPLG